MKKIIQLLLVLLSAVNIFAVSIDDLQSSAKLNNTSIKTACQDVYKAQLDVKNAKAGMMPSIDLTVTGSYLCNPIEPIRINLGDYVSNKSFLNGFGNDYITLFEGQEKTYYQFSLSATQPVFTWGKLKNAVDLYNKVYEVRQIQYEDAVAKTFTEIKTRLAVLHYLYRIETILNEQQNISRRLVELSKSAYDNGMMIETDYLDVKVKTSQIDVAKAQINQQIMQMQTAIKTLTGVDIDSDNLEFDENSLFSLVDDICSVGYDTLLSEATSAKRNNFRILNNLQTISELTEHISSVSRNWIPDLALVVSANYQGARLPFVETDWYGKDDWDATLTLALKTTLFDGGKAKNNYRKSQSDTVQATINTDDAKSQVSSALTENFTNIEVCKSKISYQDTMTEQLKSKKAVQQDLLDSGYGSEADLLQVILDANNSEIEKIQSIISMATSAYTVCYLVEK